MKAEAKPTQRAHAVWVLARLGSLDEATLRTALGDKEAIVRVHTCRVLVEQDRLSAWQHDALLERVTDENANVVRAAAEALGHHPDARNVARLLRALREAEPRDSHLRHVVRIALRDTLRGSKPDALPNKLEGEDRLALASVLLGIGSRDGALGLIALLKGGGLPQGELPRLAGHVARHGRDADVDDLVATLVPRLGDDLRPQGAIFRAIDQGTRQRGGRLGKKTHGWGVALEARLFASPQAQDVQEGIVLAGLLRSVDRDTTLARLLADHRSPQGHRLAAVDALAAIDAPRHVALFGRTVAEDPVTEVRLQAVGVLARLNTPESRTQLVNGLAIAPAALQTSIATALATSKEGGEALLQAVEAGKASARLLQEKGVDGFLRASKVRDVDGRTAKLTAGLPSADRKILDLIKKRRDGFATGRSDVVQGQKVFEKHCANCHQIASKGAKIGPQLDGVGIRGLDRILEDTLDPNRNVDQAFRTTTLNLKKGQVLSGLLLREEGAVLVLADNQGKEVRVNVDDVEERRLTPLSPMPANLAEQIPEAEFYHLLAYLLAQRVPGK